MLMDNCLLDLYCKAAITYDTALGRARYPDRIIRQGKITVRLLIHGTRNVLPVYGSRTSCPAREAAQIHVARVGCVGARSITRSAGHGCPVGATMRGSLQAGVAVGRFRGARSRRNHPRNRRFLREERATDRPKWP